MGPADSKEPIIREGRSSYRPSFCSDRQGVPEPDRDSFYISCGYAGFEAGDAGKAARDRLSKTAAFLIFYAIGIYGDFIQVGV